MGVWFQVRGPLHDKHIIFKDSVHRVLLSQFHRIYFNIRLDCSFQITFRSDRIERPRSRSRTSVYGPAHQLQIRSRVSSRESLLETPVKIKSQVLMFMVFSLFKTVSVTILESNFQKLFALKLILVVLEFWWTTVRLVDSRG